MSLPLMRTKRVKSEVDMVKEGVKEEKGNLSRFFPTEFDFEAVKTNQGTMNSNQTSQSGRRNFGNQRKAEIQNSKVMGMFSGQENEMDLNVLEGEAGLSLID